MRIRVLTIIGVAISIICILIMANSIEQGDTNAVSMYLVLFLVPSTILVILNGLLLLRLKKQKSRLLKVIGSLLPIIILGLLSLKNDMTFSGIDGNLVFIAQVSVIALGVTNLLWIMSNIKAKPTK